jgi:hypothetical protein
VGQRGQELPAGTLTRHALLELPARNPQEPQIPGPPRRSAQADADNRPSRPPFGGRGARRRRSMPGRVRRLDRWSRAGDGARGRDACGEGRLDSRVARNHRRPMGRGLMWGAALTLLACARPVPVTRLAGTHTPSMPQPHVAEPTREARAPTEAQQASAVIQEAPASDAPACSPGSSPCMPDSGFVDQLCRSPNPDLALMMFRKGTPWSRGYATRNVEAWYAGGRSRTSANTVALDEEVVVLRRRGEAGALQVSGSGSYDVLRLDGACVSLQREELTTRRPQVTKHPRVPWAQLDEPTRGRLLSDGRVLSSYRRSRSTCANGSAAACSRAESDLSDSVVEYVQRGGGAEE